MFPIVSKLRQRCVLCVLVREEDAKVIGKYRMLPLDRTCLVLDITTRKWASSDHLPLAEVTARAQDSLAATLRLVEFEDRLYKRLHLDIKPYILYLGPENLEYKDGLWLRTSHLGLSLARREGGRRASQENPTRQ